MDWIQYILELTAAENAKKRGLVYAGFGKWKIPNGPTVAKTEKGKLVALKKAEKPKKKEKKLAPAEQQAVKLGLQPVGDGRWRWPNGPIVAKVVNGKLKDITKAEKK